MQFIRYWLELLGIRGNRAGQAVCSKTSRKSSSRPSRSRSSRSVLQVETLETRAVPAYVTGNGTGLTGSYYSEQDLTNLALTRIDPTINFNWDGKSPAANMSEDHFSVRWTGVIQAPESGKYTFTTLSDDGIRVIINGQTIINNWTDHGPTYNNGTITLVAGQKYSIEIDYYQNAQGAEAQLAWTRPDGVHQVVPTSQLYSRDTTPPTASLSAKSITVPTTAAYTFQVTYTDDVQVYGSSIRSGNVVVTGPDGYKQTATLVSVNQSGNASTLTATYKIPAPDGDWDAAASGTYTVSLQANQVHDTSGNFMAAKTLGTFSVPLSGSDWYSAHFEEASFANLVRSLDVNHSLTRNDVIEILRSVESGGVTTAEFTDLKALVANAAYLGMPDYVTDLASKAINGNPANATYQGAALGNLHAGSTGTQLEDLVDKWFLGSDNPTLESGLHYQLAAGTLFGSTGPSYTDIVQGTLDDCYFLAGLGETVLHSPSTIKNMFINNGDGTYTVKFMENGTPDYVTVNSSLPANADGTYEYANGGMSLSNSNNKLWVALAEKAYAEVAQEGWTRGAGKPDAYTSINIGWEGDAINQLTGKTESYQQITDTSSTLTTLASGIQAGKWIGLETKTTTASGIVPDHVYMLLGYNSKTEVFTLYNPWGSTVQLSWAQVESNFIGFSENVS